MITSINREKDSGYVDLGLYKDYVHMSEINENVQFFLGWDAQNGDRGKEKQLSVDLESRARAIELKLAGKQSGKQVVVQELAYWTADDQPLIELMRNMGGAYRAKVPNNATGDNDAAK